MLTNSIQQIEIFSCFFNRGRKLINNSNNFDPIHYHTNILVEGVIYLTDNFNYITVIVVAELSGATTIKVYFYIHKLYNDIFTIVNKHGCLSNYTIQHLTFN